MKKATLYVREDPALLNNAIFSGAAIYGMKSDMYMYVALREALEKKGITLCTQDLHPLSDSDLVIVLNETAAFRSYSKPPNQKLYLILSEPPIYNFQDWQPEHHGAFDKVFVYDDRMVDNKKYFHYNFAIDIEALENPQPVSRQQFEDRKLCVLMAGALSILPHQPELRSLLYERYLAVRWFNRHHPDDLALYSRVRIEKKFEEFRGASLLAKVAPSILKTIARKKFERNATAVYKGSAPADEKTEVMKKYRFYLCYENTYGINGLISEKIFDCFAASCVPIYKGAPDIGKYIPSGCFINKDDFPSYPELYNYLANMRYTEYTTYIENMIKFTRSEAISPFRVDTTVNLLLSQIV